MDLDSLRLSIDGAELLRGAAVAYLGSLRETLSQLPADSPGLRLADVAGLDAILAQDSPAGEIAANYIGASALPVRALLFDKSVKTNWALGWHQDRTIAVEERVDTPGFGPWTIKQGVPHVAPPFAILEAMVTLRVHLDPVAADNAPLLIAPGSHRRLVRESEIDAEVASRGVVACLAEAGDIWVYATPILHASNAAASPTHRRVLQVDYAAGDLPGGLRWRGI